MNEAVQAIGDAVQGAMMARAVEPGAGEGGHFHETACLNCGTELVGPHCHACGQAAHVHRTLGAFFHDLAHGVFHVEGKIWRTLPMLVWNPGRLTREYIDGRRASYVSPMACFLFAVFLLFAAIHAFEPDLGAGGRKSVAQAVAEQERIVADSRAKLARLAAEEPRATGERRGDIADSRKDEQERIAEATATVKRLRQLQAAGLTDVSNALIEDDQVKTYSDIGWIDQAIRKARENPELLVYKLQSTAYKYSWLLIPISVPFVWLLFPFSRRFRAYDHTVFVTYSLSFMMLLWAGLVAVAGLGAGWLGTVASVVPPVHMYRQLRGAYLLPVRKALWRTAVLCGFAVLALALFAMAMVAMGVA